MVAKAIVAQSVTDGSIIQIGVNKENSGLIIRQAKKEG